MKATLIIICLFVFETEIYSQVISEIHEIDSNLNEVESLEGEVFPIEMESTILKEYRRVDVYLPPNYHKDSLYGFLLTTDLDVAYLAPKVEYLIKNKAIEPICIVSVLSGSPDHVEQIFKNNNISFRDLEYLKFGYDLIPNEDFLYDPLLFEIGRERYVNFSSFIIIELIPYLQGLFSITPDKNRWSIGGTSNGGAFVFGFTSDNPDIFKFAIAISPAHGSISGYNFQNSSCNYFIAAGNREEPFLYESLRYIPNMEKNGIQFLHKTYNSGHDYTMWLTFYIDSIKKIYSKE